MRYAEPNISQDEIKERADKLRNPKTYWETFVGMHRDFQGPGRGVRSGFATLFLLGFPITYPLFRLTRSPHQLEWVRLAFWPFYEFKLGLSAGKGVGEARCLGGSD